MQPITVRTVENTADCQRVVSLTAHAFPEEVRGAGLTPAQYLDIESEELSQQPWIWPYIGGLLDPLVWKESVMHGQNNVGGSRAKHTSADI